MGDVGFLGDAILVAVASESGGGVNTGAAGTFLNAEPSCKPRPLALEGVTERSFVELSTCGFGAFGVFSLDLLGVRGRLDASGDDSGVVFRSPSESGGDETNLGRSGRTSTFFGVTGFTAAL